MLDWHECEKSGHLVTHGNKGNYWILDLGLVYLELINATPSGPDIEKIGTFTEVSDAKWVAERWDKA